MIRLEEYTTPLSVSSAVVVYLLGMERARAPSTLETNHKKCQANKGPRIRRWDTPSLAWNNNPMPLLILFRSA